MPHPFRLYNTLTRKVEDFLPIEAGKVRLYVCGMTVYDHCHVGHARAMVVFDAFTRYLRHRGWEVTFVRNFTDVDDKIIARALEKGQDPLAFANHFIDEFHVEMAELGLELPTHEPRVSDSMDAIRELIETLVARGHAYPAGGNVWFSVTTCEDYGKLSNQRVDELKSGDDVQGKAHGSDFALWKAAKPGEPAWPSRWGPGRPGWHIECSAMVCKHLGETIDIHGGGLDLVFPHHENEIAQSECGIAKPYARYWMHNGLLTLSGGQKMGKSLGNVINIHTALSEFPAEAIRLYYLHNQYRSPLPWNSDALPEALTMLSRLYDALEKAQAMQGDEEPERVAKDLGEDALAVLELGRGFTEKFLAACDQDFNTAQALAHLFELARAVNRFAAHKKAKKRGRPVVTPALRAFELLRSALGLFTMAPNEFHAVVKSKRLAALGLDRAAVEAKLAERTRARETKDWARSDALRDELAALKIEVLDLADGVDWRVQLD